MRSLLYSGDLLAVDLGTFAVKALQLKAKERSLTVHASASREVWRELSEAKTDEEKNAVYARTLRELLAAPGFKVRNSSISLSGNVVIVRFAALASGAKLDPETGLSAEVRALIPFDEPDVAVSSLPIGGVGGDAPRPELMVAAAQRKTVLGAMDVVRKAGLRPAVLINDVLALANAYAFFQGQKTEETVVLVNAGAASTSVCVLEGGVPKAARVFNIAGNTLTRSLKREFGVELEEAERLKLEHGLSAGDEDVAGRVARALRPAVKDLSGEIQRTIDVFLERRPADYPAIRRIVLAGGSAELKGLPEALAADTGLLVEVFRPMVNVTAKGGLGISALAPALAVPCGLGLSNALLRKSRSSRINLIPKKVRRAAIIRDVSPGFWRLISVPVAAATALSVYGVWAVKLSRRESDAEQRLEEAAKAGRDLQSRFTKSKVVAPVRRPENPYSYLGRLSISGVFGDASNTHVMLNGGGAVYVARGGRLFDANEEEVRGVATKIRDNALVLTAGGAYYSIALPK